MTIIRYRIKVHFKGCPEKIFYFQSFDRKIDAINFVNQYQEKSYIYALEIEEYTK
ncbi:MAG: hypothetical protein J6S85_12655 [Methanobrevibacter sp.]|nr:hypothetical protein [Methanobrevibacter sp.]